MQKKCFWLLEEEEEQNESKTVVESEKTVSKSLSLSKSKKEKKALKSKLEDDEREERYTSSSESMLVPKAEETEKNIAETTIAEGETTKEENTTQQAGIFKDELLFAMPLAGNIVMDYSVDHTIYDATLDQYRTNDHISIEAKKGDSVKAAEDGTVESIQTDDERGITVVINHENGWQTTYSQLQEDVVVKEGDKVKKGQEIGFVAEPTKYSVALGEHMDFSMAKDGIKVDPKSNVAE